MPTYVYECTCCRYQFERRRTVAERDECPPCPECAASSERAFVPLYFNMNGASSKHDNDPTTQWQFKNLDDKAWSQSRQI